ncbi:SAM-dependent methyltransferase [Prochlorococcus marinus]|uniref:SAM-dependent methyltransferase n=1 Tax=Prochlorococcus marinus TaxID=1219 RepID=UPI001ADB0AD7|nr:SAM-dependent methyltransferase [Prochlorococcus marinus]MBO8220763.1 SAM-dependent methyltransferase [Prochlorococcus marinus CUG1417]MBW3075391.1 SAM-dependent methyltransferase [Prochlorococcus marinus str. MU1417]
MNSLPANNPDWLVKKIIKMGGTISFYDYMNFVLNDPSNGYYGSGKAELGVRGDFVTSPSLSDDFSFLVGKQIEDWLNQFKSSFLSNHKLVVIEFGAGDGTFMSGLIKYFLESSKNFLEGVSFVIIEPNEGMAEKQKNKLEEFLNLGIDILWKRLEELEENNINGIVIANEVLDALPVERIIFSKGKLLRQAVSIDKKSDKLFLDEMPITIELGKSIELAKSELGISIPPEDALEGWTTEWHIDNSKWLKAIYGKINNGILLIIDYAKEAKKYYNSKNSDGTIVSYENQKMINNVLNSPGNCDLTSHLCIETLINGAETLGFNTVGIAKQGEALLALGLAERLYGIQKEFKEDLSNALLRREALLRLVDPVCLGDFKWFVFNKFKGTEMNINSICLR